MKVVLDTNVLVSAFIVKKGNSARILQYIPKLEFITSKKILAETKEVLYRKHIRRKYKVSEKEIKEYIAVLKQICTLVFPTIKVDKIKDDPDDNIFLEVAKEAKADYIVSGDPHLTKLKKFNTILILTPAQFLKTLS